MTAIDNVNLRYMGYHARNRHWALALDWCSLLRFHYKDYNIKSFGKWKRTGAKAQSLE